LLALLVSLFITRYAYAGTIFRLLLYLTSVAIAYFLAQFDMTPVELIWLSGFMAILIICLMTAIRMTRRQEFSLTTQDLLILLVVILLPLLPFDILDQYAIGRIALIVAILMYTSEFVLNRATRTVAFTSACAVAGLLLALNI
jgi:hypothetical protein